MSRRNARALDTLVREVRGQRPQTTVYTFRAGDGSDSDHKPWLKDAAGIGVVRAADIMTKSGDTLARNLAAKLGKHPALGAGAYVIWKQRIISTDRLGEGWRAMKDRGDPTANHMDHVHVSLTTQQAGYDARTTWGALFTGAGIGSGGAAAGVGDLSPVVVDLAGNPISTGGAGTDVGLGIPGIDLEDIGPALFKLVVVGGALTLGAMLVVLGTVRVTKPAREAATETAGQALSLAVPQARAATAAATATKGAR